MKDYLWQMLSATQYLHAQHILHLDLRSENMMVTEYNLLKVIDLGNAQSLSQEKVPPPENFKDYLETMGTYKTPDLSPDLLGQGGSSSLLVPLTPSSTDIPSTRLSLEPHAGDYSLGPDTLACHLAPPLTSTT